MDMAYIDEFSSRLGLTFDSERVPEHVAIVMDGNGRWAKQRGLERNMGHRRRKLGVRYLTVYAFSTENWSRPKAEIGTLMNLLSEFADKKLNRLKANQVKVQVVGDFAGLPMLQRLALKHLLDATAQEKELVLNLALKYGGRADILQALKQAARQLTPDEVQNMTEDDFAGFLQTAGLPEPDLLIRTSGELRLSNFLLWQLAYAEFYFTDTLWPDFDEAELFRAICAYQSRSRRFGALAEA